MALLKCYECGHLVSPSAQACPSCGAPFATPKIKKDIGCFGSTVVVVIAVVAFIVLLPMCFSSGSSSKKNLSGSYNTSSSAWNGSVPCVEKHIKNTLKDPDSYKSYKWSKVEKNTDGTFLVAHEYGAKNGYGGMVKKAKYFTYDSNGKILSAKPASFND